MSKPLRISIEFLWVVGLFGIVTVTSSNHSKSVHRLAHKKGFCIPVKPTQYEMSTMRASSSRSSKTSAEMLLAEDRRLPVSGACNTGLAYTAVRSRERYR